jgi:hypothetical protein
MVGENVLNIMIHLIYTIHETGERSEDFIEVTMTAIRKKSKGTKHSDHRTISLIAHTAKAAARIPRRRI